ncbi:hypothetical protein X743_28520 [Mesorhizobium sp. LNHC252B00]|nr:hypothetical protein X743_28520 [Mesorhizobium sp. LNHC252B00]
MRQSGTQCADRYLATPAADVEAFFAWLSEQGDLFSLIAEIGIRSLKSFRTLELVLVRMLERILGAVSYGIYTMSIIELGERFTGSTLVAGNAAFSLMWGVGGIAVAPLAGTAMDVLGAGGLPITLGLMCLALAIASVVGRRSA